MTNSFEPGRARRGRGGGGGGRESDPLRPTNNQPTTFLSPFSPPPLGTCERKKAGSALCHKPRQATPPPLSPPPTTTTDKTEANSSCVLQYIVTSPSPCHTLPFRKGGEEEVWFFFAAWQQRKRTFVHATRHIYYNQRLLPLPLFSLVVMRR